MQQGPLLIVPPRTPHVPHHGSRRKADMRSTGSGIGVLPPAW